MRLSYIVMGVLGLAVATAGTAWAGAGRFGGKMRHSATSQAAGERGHRFMARLTEDLGLTADQQAKIEPILKKAHQDAQAATDRKDKMKIMKDAWAQVKALLTPEQATKLEDLHKKRMEKHAQGGGFGGRHKAASQPASGV